MFPQMNLGSIMLKAKANQHTDTIIYDVLENQRQCVNLVNELSSKDSNMKITTTRKHRHARKWKGTSI